MASVRASVMTQAQAAARRLGAASDDAASAPVVDQLVRCARLSQDAEHTLDWALATLRAHATVGSDKVACQLLLAARARLERSSAAAPSSTASTNADRSLAWL
jgi:hypothetical protein